MATGLGHDEFLAFAPYDFKSANEDYARNFFHKENMVAGARSRVGIITCCDARCSPDQFFRLGENEAFVIRNGGGRTASADVLRTIAVIEIVSEIRELKVIHHTGQCFTGGLRCRVSSCRIWERLG
jgi:carbonic anhydrase